MATELGAWLRTQREERGWSRSEMARRLITAARETGDGSMPDAETVRSYIYRWEHGKIHTLSERYVLYYCRTLEIKPAQFGPQPEPAPDTAVIQPAVAIPAGPGVSYCQQVAYRGIEAPESRQSTVRDEVLMAAHEGSEHAEQAERRDFGDSHPGAAARGCRAPVGRADDRRPVRHVPGDAPGPRSRLPAARRRSSARATRPICTSCSACLSDLMAVPAIRARLPAGCRGTDPGRLGLRVGDRQPSPDGAPAAAAGQHHALGRAAPTRPANSPKTGSATSRPGPTGANLHLKYAQAAARTGDADGARRALAAATDARELAAHR